MAQSEYWNEGKGDTDVIYPQIVQVNAMMLMISRIQYNNHFISAENNDFLQVECSIVDGAFSQITLIQLTFINQAGWPFRRTTTTVCCCISIAT